MKQVEKFLPAKDGEKARLAAIDELRWVFRRNATGRDPEPVIGDNGAPDPSATDFVEREILGLLREVADPDAGVLFCAYSERDWPKPLVDELGVLAGVVARMSAAEVGLPEDEGRLCALEMREAYRLNAVLLQRGRRELERLIATAKERHDRAFVAYMRERGRTASRLGKLPS